MVPVCPAIGFVNPGPVTIEVAPALTVGEVAACFGDGCAPTPRLGGAWTRSRDRIRHHTARLDPTPFL